MAEDFDPNAPLLAPEDYMQGHEQQSRQSTAFDSNASLLSEDYMQEHEQQSRKSITPNELKSGPRGPADTNFGQKKREKCHILTEKEIELCRDWFDFFDTNRNGEIEVGELKKAIRVMDQYPSEEELTYLIRSVPKKRKDSEMADTITFDEYKEMMEYCWRSKELTVMEMMNAFLIFDVNKDGFISADELLNVVTQLGEKLTKKEAMDVLRLADTDGDGRINYKEFTDLITNGPKSNRR